MPNLFKLGGYVVYFWSNENNEPIHVHIAEGEPSQGATKLWLTKTGGCVPANNNSRIPEQDLNTLMEMVSAQFLWICSKWKSHFSIEKIEFYC